MGRAVVADALQSTDPVGARAAEQATAWRTDYLVHFRRLVEAGLDSPEAAVDVAKGGLESLHERMRVTREDGEERRLDEWDSPASPGSNAAKDVEGVEVVGNGKPVDELVLPYHGERLRGTGSGAGSRPGPRPGSSSRPSETRSARCSTTRTGCGSRDTRSRCSARVPRWGRCRR